MIKQWIKYSVLVLIIVNIGLAISWWAIVRYIHTPSVAKETIIEIPKGASLSHISHILSAQKLITYPVLWKIYSRIIGQSTSMRAGEYYVPKGSTGRDLMNLFTSGKVIQHKLLLLPGMTVNKALTLVADLPKINNDLKELSEASFAEYLGISENCPEGLFYPDTYFYTAHSNASAIMLRAYLQLKEKLNLLWQKRAENLPYKTPYDALIIASLIAKEASVAEERKKIAGVFIRRLQQGMRLQSDPTVIYGMGHHFQGKLTTHDLQRKTTYNTYRINGLPPTPIALVTAADIEAALHPLQGKALYFVAKGDGTHVFSETLEEQQLAVKKYQLNRRNDYRSVSLSTSNYHHTGKKERK